MSKVTKPTGRGRFTPALTSEDGYSLLWASQGVGGSGKSHFLMTAPEPIAIHVFSDPLGVSTLMRKDEFKDKDISVIHYNFQPGKYKTDEARQEAAAEVLDQFIEDYQGALKSFRTVGWDKEDQVYELLRYARLGSVSDRPSAYYELNLEYRGWFADAAEAGVNLGVIRGMKEAWGSDDRGKPKSLGTMVPRGQREVNELVQVVLDHRWDDEQRQFVTKIHEKCRVGPATELIGQEFGSLDFETLASMLYPDADPSVWAAA